MKTFKKLFSVSAIVALLGTLAPMYAFGATYSEEEQEAYAYAYSKQITTMPTIDQANMNGTLTRIEMAKMIANYAMNVLGLEPDTSKTCTFTDVTAERDATYANWVKNSCQLGLMGQNITAFRPDDPVTRGEFGTTLSRALNANDADKLAELNSANPFYEKHLAFLNAAGIMKNISTPNAPERRSWVMIMMMRADEDYTTASEGCSMNELLACFGSSDITACMAECSGTEPENPDEPTVVKAGTLNVSATANDWAKIFLWGESELDTIKLNASEEITVEKVTLEKYGYTTNTWITVWLENEDGIKISSEKTLTSSKDEVTLTIKRDYRNALENKAYTIVVNVDTWHAVWDTLWFKVTDVTSSAETLRISSYTPTTYSMVTYTSSSVSAELKWKDTTYNYEAWKEYQIAKFRLKAGNAEISVKWFTLKETAKSLDMEKYIDEITVKAGDTTLRLSTSDVNRDWTIKVVFPEQSIEAKKNVDFTVYATLTEDFEDFGDSITLTIDAVDAKEVKTSARVTPTVTGTSPKYTFQGTKIKLTNTNLWKVSAFWGAEDVIVAEWTLELAEAVELNNFVINVTTWTIENLELWLNGSLVAEWELNTWKTAFTFSKALLEKAGKLQFAADFYDIDETINSGATSVSLSPTFNKTLLSSITTWSIGRYDDSNEIVAVDNFAGSMSFSAVTIETAKWNLENTINQRVEVLAEWNATRVTLFDGKYTAKKGDVYLNSWSISSTAPLSTDESITFYVTIADTDFDVTLESGDTADSVTFTDVLVRKWESVNVKVEAEVIAYKTGDLIYKLALDGEDDDTNPVTGAAENMVTLKRVSAWSVTVVAATKANDVVLRWNNISLAKFTVKPKLDNTRLTSIELSWLILSWSSTWLAANNLKVVVDGTILDASEGEYSVTTGWVLTTSGLDVAMDSDGVDVEITLKTTDEDGADDGEYAISLTKVNGSNVSKSFNKYIVPVLVKITAQENLWDTTKFTFSVDKYDESYDVEDFKFNTYTIWTITDGQIEEVENDTTVTFLNNINYKVGWKLININKDTYRDYFRLWDSFLKVFKAQD